MPASLALRTEWIKRTFTATALTDPGVDERPTGWKVRLHTADPTESGLVSQVSGSGYVADGVAATFTQTAGVARNTAAIVFATVATTEYTVTHVSVWSSNGTPRCLHFGALTLAKLIPVGEAFSFAVNELECNVV